MGFTMLPVKVQARKSAEKRGLKCTYGKVVKSEESMSFEPGTLAIRQKAVNELMECTLQELFTLAVQRCHT
jgi:hypothetical protein